VNHSFLFKTPWALGFKPLLQEWTNVITFQRIFLKHLSSRTFQTSLMTKLFFQSFHPLLRKTLLLVLKFYLKVLWKLFLLKEIILDQRTLFSNFWKNILVYKKETYSIPSKHLSCHKSQTQPFPLSVFDLNGIVLTCLSLFENLLVCGWNQTWACDPSDQNSSKTPLVK
jgi:hypothetical protein